MPKFPLKSVLGGDGLPIAAGDIVVATGMSPDGGGRWYDRATYCVREVYNAHSGLDYLGLRSTSPGSKDGSAQLPERYARVPGQCKPKRGAR